jgi:hypothetical protein
MNKRERTQFNNMKKAIRQLDLLKRKIKKLDPEAIEFQSTGRFLDALGKVKEGKNPS